MNVCMPTAVRRFRDEPVEPVPVEPVEPVPVEPVESVEPVVALAVAAVAPVAAAPVAGIDAVPVLRLWAPGPEPGEPCSVQTSAADRPSRAVTATLVTKTV